MKALSASFVLGTALALLACAPDGRGGDGSGDGTGDGTGSGSGTGTGTGTAKTCGKMDLVFVIDDSGSMTEEQQNLSVNFPMFADVLLDYVNPDGDHVDFRIAVTTTARDMTFNMSSAGVTVPVTDYGDDGAFRTSCGAGKRWLEPADPNLGETLGCRADVGTSGSMFEMPMLMTKWALAERVVDGTNAGFVRDDALLGIVMLTDEDDGSVQQDGFTLSLGQTEPPVDFHPADLVQFLDALKGHRTRWAAGVIAGPTSCTSAFGDAMEAVRLKDFVAQANASGPQQAVFASICDGDLTAALQAVLAKFQSACGDIIL